MSAEWKNPIDLVESMPTRHQITITREELRKLLEEEYPLLTPKDVEDVLNYRTEQIIFFNKKRLCPEERGCCKLACSFFCVCERSYFCPVHGERHIGTHD